MGSDTVAPPPPPGFDTDVTPTQASGSTPPPPPGFDTDVTGSQSPPSPYGGTIPLNTATSSDLERSPNYPNAKMTDPSAQDAMTAYGVGSILKRGAMWGGGKLSSLFSTPETLGNSGISSSTLGKLTPQGMNAEQSAEGLASQMKEEGTLTGSPIKSQENLRPIVEQSGHDVRQALDDLRNEAQTQSHSVMGAYSSFNDPTAIDANEALKPLLDESNALMKTGQRESIQFARELKGTYGRLADAANANNGTLTFDDLENERKLIGDSMNTAGPNRQGILSQVYSRIYRMKDSMIQDIADQAQNPDLRENLLSANESYSRNTRLLDDVTAAANRQMTAKSEAPLAGEGKRLLRWLPLGAVAYPAVRALRKDVIP